MNHTQSLPEPSADALNHSAKLINTIRDEIERSETNSISFKRYMEMALYQPSLGYYVAGTHKIGEQGDFITAPEISPLFSQCIANQSKEILKKVGGCTSTGVYPEPAEKLRNRLDGVYPELAEGAQQNSLLSDILELGAGSGKMACDILLTLEKQDQLPRRYYILDLSPDLIKRQQTTLKEHAPHLLERVEWITELPQNFVGIILGNEVLDAMPVHVFTQQGKEIYEHHVIWQDGKLTEQLKPANEKLAHQVRKLNIQSDRPYTSEINPNINAWLKSIDDCLDKGAILLIDYGYSRKEYYLPERNKGTLICHYQHLVNDAPLMYPGLQDITANVDFTAVAEAADEIDLEVSGYTSQAHFLANTGLEAYFMQALDNKQNDDQAHQYRLAQQVRTLSLPSEMGERFKCIALTKNLYESSDDTLIGFKSFDQRYRL